MHGSVDKSAMAKTRPQRLVETIDRLFHLEAIPNLQKILAKMMPADLAQVLESFPQDEAKELFLLIPDVTAAAQVLKELHVSLQQTILSELPPARLGPIVERLAPDTRADILAVLEPELAARYMNHLDVETRREMEKLMRYAPDTAGGLMTSQFFALPQETRVKEAIEAVRGVAAYEMVFYLYVVDEVGRLVGVSSLRQLLLADPDKTLAEMMNRKAVKVRVDTPQDELSDIVSHYRLLALPVVDEEGVLSGLITVDDVMSIMEYETTDDILKVAGTSASEIEASSPWQVLRIRMPWMLVTFIGGFLTSGIVHVFDDDLTQALVVSAFLPLILGMGGNFGTVAATVAARNLATGAIPLARFFSILRRELATGMMLGAVYGVLALGISWALFRDLLLGEAVGLAIFANLVMAAVVATLLPNLFKRFGVDPGLASGPVVVAAVDLLGVTNYFLIAALLQFQMGR